MKRILFLACACAFILGTNACAATHSGQAIEEAGKASVHASASAAHAIAASGQATSAVSAVPVAMVGSSATAVGSVAKSAGQASMEGAGNLMKMATAPIGEPLPMTDETFSVGPPPDQALAPQKDASQRKP